MADKAKIGVIFIHGAGLGSWIWQDVAKQLKNVQSLAVDFPKRGEPSETRKDMPMEEYIEAVMSQVETLQADKYIVVGHSLGGVIALEVASRLGEQVVGFVGIAASIPKPGKSFLATLPFPNKYIMSLILRLAGTKPPESAIRQSLCSGLDEKQTDKIVKTFAPESLSIYTSPVEYQLSNIPTLYIRTTADKEFTEAMQTTMAQNLPKVKITSIASGHMPMLSHAKEIASLLNAYQDAISAL